MHPTRTRNIWAVGRNYSEHAKEMNAEIPKEPLIFLKAGSCIETSSRLKLPDWSIDIHHELEIAFLIDENLSFSHVSLALDLTERQLQSVAKSKGTPWTLSKSFIGSCPLGNWIDLKDINHLDELELQLSKNNVVVQKAIASEMIFKPADLLTYVKNHFPVCPQDILLSGTPSGVGPIKSGDLLEATLKLKNQSSNRPLLACIWDVE